MISSSSAAQDREAAEKGGKRAGSKAVARAAGTAAAHGLATPFGDTGSVGLAGLTLGGGIGWLVRKHGLTIDSLVSVELVTADGQAVVWASRVLRRPLPERVTGIDLMDALKQSLGHKRSSKAAKTAKRSKAHGRKRKAA